MGWSTTGTSSGSPSDRRRGRAPPRKGSLVLLDTNAAFLPFREGVELAAEVDRWLPGAEIAVPAAVGAELDALVRRKAPLADAARRYARALRSVPSTGRGDRAVVDAAVRHRATVVTADRALAETLRDRGVAVLVPRDRSRLELRLPRFAAAPGRPSKAPSVKKRPKP